MQIWKPSEKRQPPSKTHKHEGELPEVHGSKMQRGKLRPREGRSPYLENSSRRPCSGQPRPGSSQAHTASCSRQTPVGTAALGTDLGKEAEKLQTRRLGKGPHSPPNPEAPPSLTMASSQTPHISSVQPFRGSPEAQRGQGYCVHSTREEGTHCPPTSSCPLFLLRPPCHSFPQPRLMALSLPCSKLWVQLC